MHETRPECRDFFCLWMTESSVPAQWKPDRSKMVLSVFPKTGFIHVQVDPGAPQAWKKQPFRISASLQDLSLGTMNPTEGFSIRGEMGLSGVEYEVVRETR